MGCMYLKSNNYGEKNHGVSWIRRPLPPLDLPKATEIRPKCHNHLVTQSLAGNYSKLEN